MRPVLRHPDLHPFSGLDMAALVDDRAARWGDKPFLIWEPFSGPAESVSYAAFRDRTMRLAAGLHGRGLRAGDFLLIHLDNCLETVLAWHACARLGVVAVTTNARSAGAELAYFAEHCGAVAGITQPRFAGLVARHCPALKWLAVTATDNGEAPEPGSERPADATMPVLPFGDLDGDPAGLPARAVDPMAPICVQYTSGTTSRPKGVLWTHANALWGARINAAHQTLRADDVHLTFLPLFHTNAQAYSVLSSLWAGATAVLQPRFSASRFWPVALKHGCTWCSMVPFVNRALAAQPVPPDHRFRLWGNAACLDTAPAFGVPTMGWWGMTETLTHGIVSDPAHRYAPEAIGHPAPEYEIAVLRDDGTPCGPGEAGHLRIRGIPGLSLFQEYLNNPQATEESFDADGFFITGDRVIRMPDGAIRFADRDKDMLKVGGENVASSEIERVILTVPGVEEVAVVAQPDPMRDEVPVAFILPAAGAARAEMEQAVLATCRDALADFKVPVAVHLVDEMPRSTLEKIAKAELRKWLSATS
ncbi:AMP-binding protein [Marinibaculum pumilum]|uniref:AMP-binding protein n=1 Tax=Marinibaculum pumilum TaxID=1766165 RepID=A0ABV7L7Z6_9PROT